MDTAPSPSYRQLAESLNQPRTLDGYREHFKTSLEAREGLVDLKKVENGDDPNQIDWQTKFLALRDGIVYVGSGQDSSDETELVRVSSVRSVKTVQSWNSKTIIKLSTSSFSYFIDAQTEEDMREWLFSFHTAVMVYIIGGDPETTRTTRAFGRLDLASPGPHRMMFSSDSKLNPLVGVRDRFWSHADGEDHYDNSGPPTVPLVDSFGGSGNDFFRMPTRDFNAPLTSRRCSSSSISPPRRYNLSDSPFTSPIKTSSPVGSLSPKRRGSSFMEFATTPSFSTKLDREPPLQGGRSASPLLARSTAFDGGNENQHLKSGLFSTSHTVTRQSENSSQTEVLHSQLPLSSIASSIEDDDDDNAEYDETIHETSEPPQSELPKPAPSRYVPPHLRGGNSKPEPLDFGEGASDCGQGSDELCKNERSSVLKRGGQPSFSSAGDSDDTLFQMEGGSARTGKRSSSVEIDHGHPIYGRTAEQGCRSSMEDYDVTIPFLSDREFGFYGVFDGHGGTRVAQMASENIHRFCAQDERMFENWPQGAMDAVTKAFARVEEEFVAQAIQSEVEPWQDGSCALVAILHYPYVGAPRADGVAIANLGDSRVILYDNSQIIQLSQEHSPVRPDEKKRIEDIGGWVTIEREMLVEKLHRVDLSDPSIRDRVSKRFNYVEISRVNGELAVSRALGDIDYKAPRQDNYTWFFPQGHPAFGKKKYKFEDNLVDANPEWTFHPLDIHNESNEDQKSFLIIACDGLWDVVTNEEAIEICKSSPSPQAASDRLVSDALRMGSSDNVSVLVVSLSRGTFDFPTDS